MAEIWKDLNGYEGLYQISDLGNVKSIYCSNHRILKQSLKGKYLSVCLFKNNERKTIRVHQLVAIAFLNHKPNGFEFVVDHIDKNRQNNKLDNIRIVTQRENTSNPNVKKTSQYTGVYRKGKKWASSIYLNGKTKHLGYFFTEIDASNAYINEMRRIWAMKKI